MTKHIVITGASSGIGEALALHYADKGVILSLIARNITRLRNVADQCRAKGAVVHVHSIDVTDKNAMAACMESCEKIAPVDLVIANAGVGLVNAGVETPEALAMSEQTLDINMYGVTNTIHPIIPHMIQRRGGQIALMASLAGYRGLPETAAYSGSKAFVKVYGESLRGTLAKHNIRVNVICPGFVKSRLTDQNTCPMPFLMDSDKAAAIIAKNLAKNRGRIAFPWPMALAVWFMAALPDCIAGWVTSHVPAKAETN